ncbi:MAG: hypothetical protein HDT39_14110 [Lachnospiraceae bacterium]|nr:hypothetical protein [Lachnospiraceae bacterium]
MDNKVCMVNVIKSKIVRSDFFMKLILCIVLLVCTLSGLLEIIPFEYQNIGTEECNLLMYLLLAVIVGICGGLDLSFDFTDNAIRTWAND